MSTSRLHVTVLLLVAAFAGSTPAAQARAADVEGTVRDAIASIHGPGDVLRARDDLIAVGAAGLEPLFKALATQQSSLSSAQLTTLSLALGALPRESLFSFLGRTARTEASDGERWAAFELIARLGGRGELKLALELVPADAEGAALAPELREALERALTGICTRDEGASRTLAGFFETSQPSIQASIVAVLARAGGSDAAGLLAGELGAAGSDADALLLLELGRHGATYGACDDELVLERVRGYLSNPERRLVVLACLALDKLRDYQAVPDLIYLLGDAIPTVRVRAHAALTSLTGLPFGTDSERWLAWLNEGLAWWEERGDACRVALVSGEPAEAASALVDVARQRLFVDDVIDVLTLALQRPEPDLVRNACNALRAIHEPAARAAVAELVTHSDPTVVAAVRATLEEHGRARRAESRPSPIVPLPRGKNP